MQIKGIKSRFIIFYFLYVLEHFTVYYVIVRDVKVLKEPRHLSVCTLNVTSYILGNGYELSNLLDDVLDLVPLFGLLL